MIRILGPGLRPWLWLAADILAGFFAATIILGPFLLPRPDPPAYLANQRSDSHSKQPLPLGNPLPSTGKPPLESGQNWTGLIALLSLGVFAIQTYIIFLQTGISDKQRQIMSGQLEQGKVAADAATEGAAAAKIAADAAALSAQASIGVELPRLTLNQVAMGSHIVTALRGATYQIIFINEGRTSARVLDNCVDRFIGPDPPAVPNYPTYRRERHPVGILVQAGAVYRLDCDGRGQTIEADMDAIYAISPKDKLWVWGRIRYSDFLDKFWVSRFLLQFEPQRGMPHKNSSDGVGRFVEVSDYPAYVGRERQ